MAGEALEGKLAALRGEDGKEAALAAFEEIYEELKVPVFTIVFRITKDRMLAEDVLQETFLKLYRSPPGADVKNPRAYLFQSARNLAIDSIRSRREAVGLEEAWEWAAPETDPALRVDVERALAQLAEEESQIISLHVSAELKFREIAEAMGMPLGTVLWKYRKGIRKLRGLFEEQ